MEDLALCNMKTLRALEAEVGAAVLPVLVSSLCEEIQTSRENFKTYFSKEAWQSLEVEAHALKSAALSFGAERLSQACRELEFTAKSQIQSGTKHDDIRKLISSFETHASALLEELKPLSHDITDKA